MVSLTFWFFGLVFWFGVKNETEQLEQRKKQERKTRKSFKQWEQTILENMLGHCRITVEEYTDNEPIDLERSATPITVEKRVGERMGMEVRACFPAGPTPLYFGPPFTFDSPEFVLFLFFLCLWLGSLKFNPFFLMCFFSFIQLFNTPFFLFIFSFFQNVMDFKMEKNRYWICGLVPIGKEDYRGPLSRHKLICLEEEKEALMTPSKKDLKVRFFGVKRRWIFMKKRLRFVLNIFFSLSQSICLDQFLFPPLFELFFWKVRVLGKQKEVILTAKKGEEVETAIFDVSGSKWAIGFLFVLLVHGEQNLQWYFYFSQPFFWIPLLIFIFLLNCSLFLCSFNKKQEMGLSTSNLQETLNEEKWRKSFCFKDWNQQ